MNPISFKEVALLVNHISGTRIDVESPRPFEADQYAVYSGSFSSSGFSFPFEILYLYADATKEGMRTARSWLNRKPDKSKVKVVFAPSITTSIVDDLRLIGVDCMSLADYFLSFISAQTEIYLSKIKQLSFQNYIDPQIETPIGYKRKNPNPVLGFMSTLEHEERKGGIAVLLGEPGQGKTHMSKYLISELTKKKKIPVYVHSEQWSKMQIDDLSSIWKTIVASFRYFDAPIGWAEGFEREFIQVALKLGIFRLVFDGFDEFILWNRGTIDPRESLQELLNLADETDTPLCITSRTSFWKAEIIEADGNSAFTGQNNLFQFTISPFDANHARNYFIKRFEKDDPRINQSVQLFDLLKQDSSSDAMNFVGRGFFLSLIADLVSRGFSVGKVGSDQGTRLKWIMDALCQREQVRQQLPLDAMSQLKVLREFAEITAKGEPRNSSTLSMILGVEAGLDIQQIDELVKKPAKLKDHPLICYSQKSANWLFVQDQIEYVLLAERVVELCESPKKYDQLAGLLNSHEFLKSLQTEVATSLVQQIFEQRSDTEALEHCKEIIAAISTAGRDLDAIEHPTGCNQFAGKLALLAAGKAHGRGSDRTERTNALMYLLPEGQLVGIQFVGTMSGLDLRDLTISNCHFDTVTFANCRFSNTTHFVNCRFTELRVTNCEQFGGIAWGTTNKLDDLSRRLVDAEMVMAGRKSYTDEDLFADLDCLIRRFLPRETSGFKNIEERNLSRGLIGHSVHKNLIIDAFKKHCLNCHPVAGHPVYSVMEKEKPAFVFYVGNGVVTGELAEIKEELRKKVGLSN
ncbi:MAG: NACHT domain-containing protein [Burkholderiaceae bacterium]|nr:NACHT domain-containing protein [Burkholderiaceae bacterium]